MLGIKRIFVRGEKLFELSNHLGNVLVTVTDRKIAVSAGGSSIDYYKADISSANDYYPFGMQQPGRKFNNESYRYGFNSQEKSIEVDPNRNSMTAEFWQYDVRIGRRWNIDPKPNVSISPYAVFENNPIFKYDLLGDTTAPNGSSTRDNPTVVGTLAHTTLSRYLSAQNYLGKRFQTNIILSSGKKPDIVDDGNAKAVWELKPESWTASVSYKNYQKGKSQLKDYVTEINSGGGLPFLMGTYKAGGAITDVPILSGTTLTSADNTYMFTYTIVNPESGMIFYKAQKLEPRSVPTPVNEYQKDAPPIILPPPIPFRQLPSPIPSRRPAPSLNGGRGNLWLMFMWGIYKFGEATFETNQQNIKNMNDNQRDAYLNAIMMYN